MEPMDFNILHTAVALQVTLLDYTSFVSNTSHILRL